MDFRNFLQARMSEGHHHDQSPFHARRSDYNYARPSFVSRITYHPLAQSRTAMAHNHSFFEEAFAYPLDNPTYEDARPLYYHPDPAFPNFRPQLLIGPSPIQLSTLMPGFMPSVKVESSPRLLALPTVLETHVDTSDFLPLAYTDWQTGSVDLEGSSPSSIDSYETSPTTPATDGSSAFVGQYDGGNFQLDNSNVTKTNSTMVHAPMNTYDMSAASIHQPNGIASGFASSFAAVGNHISGDDLGYGRLAMVPDVSLHRGPMPYYDAALQPQFLESALPLSFAPHQLERSASPVGSTTSSSDEEQSVSSSSSVIHEMASRNHRDQYLLDMRAQKMSYKEIKRRGHFKEAESTLRGRVRVLTKDKEDRVRRPEWTAADLLLLHEAIDHFTITDNLPGGRRVLSRRVPWKRVSLWMKRNGGTYLFAPATCAKKWEEVKGAYL